MLLLQSYKSTVYYLKSWHSGLYDTIFCLQSLNLQTIVNVEGIKLAEYF